MLGGCPCTVRRTINRYEEDGLDGLIDKRLAQVSHRRAPVHEVMRLVDRSRHQGWNVKHYTAWYKHEGGARSTTWVKNTHQPCLRWPPAPCGAGRRSLRWMLRRRAAWRVCAAWRCGCYRVIPRVVAESRNPGLRAFYRPFWMLRLRAA